MKIKSTGYTLNFYANVAIKIISSFIAISFFSISCIREKPPVEPIVDTMRLEATKKKLDIIYYEIKNQNAFDTIIK